MGDIAALIEPVPIDDDYVTDLALIERCGALARFVYATRGTCYESGDSVLIVRRKLLIERAAILRNMALVAAFMGLARPPLGHPPLWVVK